jgi:hypothetical protein
LSNAVAPSVPISAFTRSTRALGTPDVPLMTTRTRGVVSLLYCASLPSSCPSDAALYWKVPFSPGLGRKVTRSNTA